MLLCSTGDANQWVDVCFLRELENVGSDRGRSTVDDERDSICRRGCGLWKVESVVAKKTNGCSQSC